MTNFDSLTSYLMDNDRVGEEPLRVGDKLDPYANGYIGADDWSGEGVRVEAIGADWLVCRTSRGAAVFCDEGPAFMVRYRL